MSSSISERAYFSMKVVETLLLTNTVKQLDHLLLQLQLIFTLKTMAATIW